MEPWEYFDEHFVIRPVGPNLWQAFNRNDMGPVSFQSPNKEAIINYVRQNMKAEMDKQVDKLLGASDEHIRNKS